MRAWQIQADHSLKQVDQPMPTLGAQELCIAVKAIGVNRADLLQVKGLYPAPAGFDSSIPGLEYAGEIVALGERVQGRKIGEAVMGLIPSGAYAEHLCVHELEVLSIPTGLSFAQAASIPEAFLTSFRALFLEGQLQAGQSCLIRPATAAVGLAAVQLAQALGARAIGSSRDLAKLGSAQALGLTACVEENADLAKQVKALCPEGVAVIMDMLGPDWNSLLSALRPEGVLVSVGVMAGVQTQLNLFSLLTARLKIHAMTMRSQPLDQRIALARRFNDSLLPLFQAGKLQPLPVRTFDFNQAPAALADMQQGQWSGKRVILVAD